MKRTEMIAAAHRYAAANKSDPFALRRALSHISSGVAGMRLDDGGNKIPATYDAERTMVERTLPSGEKYLVEEYTNIKVM